MSEVMHVMVKADVAASASAEAFSALVLGLTQ